MKIKLLIATKENDYASHLSRVLMDKKSDVFEVSVSSSKAGLSELLETRQFDVALLDPEMIEGIKLSSVKLPLLIWDGMGEMPLAAANIPKLSKYQRISKLSSNVVEQFAAVSNAKESLGSGEKTITVVWSPCGGIGKTTVALAYATKKSSEGKRVLYLDLEPFSATSAFFKEPGNSISVLFEKMNGDLSLMFQGLCKQDAATGINYFGQPKNYDDINVLTEEDIDLLISKGAENCDELIVDLGSSCNEIDQKIMLSSDRVLLVSDSSPVSRAKCDQFRYQHNFYAKILDKLTVIANRGAKNVAANGENSMGLPKVESDNPMVVYSTLSGYMK